MSALDKIRAVAEAKSLKAMLPLIKTGIEFEFHALNGVERDSGDGDGDYDYERLSEDSLGAMNDTTISDIADYISDESAKELILALDAYGLSVDHIINCKESVKLVQIWENAQMRWREDWESNADMSEYRINCEVSNSEYCRMFSGYNEVKHLMQMGEDGTVRGGEIRTIGGLTLTDTLKVCKAIANNDFDVGFGTSFHVHLSVDGVTHAYGARFQAEMFAYLLKNYERLPGGVKRRMAHPNGAKQWARLELVNEVKYCAVYKHPQGTWEFRLFGNIDSYADFKRCLELAAYALRHAYRVKLGMENSLLGDANLNQIRSALRLAVESPTEFFEELNHRTDENPPLTDKNIENGAA